MVLIFKRFLYNFYLKDSIFIIFWYFRDINYLWSMCVPWRLLSHHGFCDRALCSKVIISLQTYWVVLVTDCYSGMRSYKGAVPSSMIRDVVILSCFKAKTHRNSKIWIRARMRGITHYLLLRIKLFYILWINSRYHTAASGITIVVWNQKLVQLLFTDSFTIN